MADQILPAFSMGCSENKSTIQFSPFEDEATPGAVIIMQDLSFSEVGYHTVVEEELVRNRKNLRQSSALRV